MNARKIIIFCIFTLFVLMCPPFMFIYNKPVMVFGLPLFLVTIVGLSLMIPILLFILYKIEYSKKKGE